MVVLRAHAEVDLGKLALQKLGKIAPQKTCSDDVKKPAATGRPAICSWLGQRLVMPDRKTPRPSSPRTSLSAIRRQAQVCRRCDLWKHATQTVFGQGTSGARIMLVGEQPGEVEDLKGEPFVGPAGQLLRRALEDAGIDLRDVYLTNVVKHFKWEPRGKRRIHKKPRHSEIQACRVWLDAEIATVKPRAIVALGATAAQTVIGPDAKVTRDRTKPFPSPLAPLVTLTVHPSSILRAPDSETRAVERAHFVDDLRSIAARVKP